MQLYDPNTVAIIDNGEEPNEFVKQPNETGKAMSPHDPANSATSGDDVINKGEDKVDVYNTWVDDFTKALEPDNIGTEGLFNFNAGFENKQNQPSTNVTDLNLSRSTLFMSLEHIAQNEVGTNPLITSGETNTQMAVFPLNDLTIPKTSDDVRDINGNKIENIIDQGELSLESLYDLVESIRAYSPESLLPVNLETGITYSEISDDNANVDAYVTALISAESNIISIREDIDNMGGIDKATAIAVEAIQPGILTSAVSIESFTSLPSRTNLNISIEKIENWIKGAKLLGAAAIFAVIVKMMFWLKDKVTGPNLVPSEKVKSAINKRVLLSETINNISNTYTDKIRTDPNIVKRINARAEKLGNKPFRAKPDDIAAANGFFLQQHTFIRLKNFSKLEEMVITNKSINKAFQLVTDFIYKKFDELLDNVAKYEQSYRSTNNLDAKNFTTKWDGLTNSMSSLGIPNVPKESERIGLHLRNTVQQFQQTKAVVPTFEKLTAMEFVADETESLDKLSKKIEEMATKATNISKGHVDIPDETIRKNREIVSKVIKDECNVLLQSITSLLVIRKCGNGLSKAIIEIVDKVEAEWKGVFTGTGIVFNLDK